MTFSTHIISWYRKNQRELPWRKNPEPYRVWLSEIIMQQTRISQGLPYYRRFIQTFPDIHELARAEEQEVLKMWQGLGYYSRARNLHKTARFISNECKGTFPDNYKDLKKLKGVGDYTASAIASICFDEPQAVVDGNVFRVLSRYFGIELPINSTAGKKRFKGVAENQLDRGKPGEHNQALMEFGALHCKPKNPFCAQCPLKKNCVAAQQNLQTKLPKKEKKVRVKTKHFNYLVLKNKDQKTLIHRRLGKGIWKNLYQFPLIESQRELYDKGLNSTEEIQAISPKIKRIQLFNHKPIKHLLSHRKLLVKFWIIEVEEFPAAPFLKNCRPIENKDLNSFPVPALIEKFFTHFDFKE